MVYEEHMIDAMPIEELRELASNLLKLTRIDAELIKTMRKMLNLDNQQGE